MNSIRKILYTSLVALTLSGCGSTSDSNICQYHIDLNNDGLCENCGKPVTKPSTKKNFEGVTFKDQTFTYDGNYHSIYVEGAPEIAKVTYVNNNKKEAGNYTVQATLTATDYNDLTLTATMSIVDTRKTFENLSMKDLTVKYDGQVHSLKVENVPSFATVKYYYNDKVDAGVYNVEAIVSANGYKSATLKARLTIQALDFEGITFKDQTITYDGNSHSIYVEGAPNFASVSYTGNDKSAKGVYTVTAKVSAKNYNTKTLTAKMTIAKAMPSFDIKDRTLIYDGSNQKVKITLPSNLPYASTAEYKVDGKTVASLNDVRVKTVGTHTVSVTLKNEQYEYDPTTSTATITVIENNIGGVDTSKSALKMTSDIKYQTLRKAILNGNFTIKYDYYDDYFYPDTTEKHEHDSTSMTYVANGEAFEFYSLDDKENNPMDYDETRYSHSKIIGDQVYISNYVNGLIDESGYYGLNKFPESAYQENVVGKIGCQAISKLKEGEDGSIQNSSQGGSPTTYGSFEIDTVNNKFTMTAVRHYYRSEFNHDEREVFTIYNIGNTTINVPNALKVDNLDKSIFENNGYYLDGIEYDLYDDHAVGDPVFNGLKRAYLDKGTYIVPAYFEGVPVTTFSSSHYSSYYNQDCSGYTYKVYFDKNGYYKGEYESLGKVEDISDFGTFIDDGGTVLYYDDWH